MNEGAAKSQGVELSANYAPIEALKLAGWITLNDAVLTVIAGGLNTSNQAAFTIIRPRIAGVTLSRRF